MACPAGGGIVAAGFLFLAAVVTVGLAKANPGGKDFIEYWAVEQGWCTSPSPNPVATIRLSNGVLASDFSGRRFW